jgi:hypothetical protein
MDTVSQNTVYYTLNQNLNGEKILGDIQRLIKDNMIEGQEYILSITIKPISITTNELIPKLEYIKDIEA